MGKRMTRTIRVALSVAGSAILLFSCEREEAEDAAASEETMRTEYSENLSIVESKNGRRSYHFVTPLVEGYSLAREPYREFRKGVKITTYKDDSLSTVDAVLTANYAIYYENRELWEAKGNVVVVEKGMKLTYDIAPAARLIDLDEYKIAGGEMLYGFVAGLMASNYDITDLYIDGILKVLDHDINRLGAVLDEMAAIAGDSVKVTVTVSADEAALPHDVKKYL